MKHSESIATLAGALAVAQGKLEGAKKDSNNPAFNSKYADLASVVAALKAVFPEVGLSYVQTPCTNDKDEVGVETMLMHSSGEWIKGEPFFMPVAKSNAHGFGSILTYARRYSLAAIAGVAPEDDDANAGVEAKRPNTAKQVAVDAFDLMDADEQKFIRDHATKIIADHEGGLEIRGYLESLRLDNEEELALWSLLPSAVRSAIKRKDA